jgi:hypothetical protein
MENASNAVTRNPATKERRNTTCFFCHRCQCCYRCLLPAAMFAEAAMLWQRCIAFACAPENKFHTAVNTDDSMAEGSVR